MPVKNNEVKVPPSYIHPVPQESFFPDMKGVKIPLEDKTTINTQALSVFTDVVNSGGTFQDALGSILATGIKWGQECALESEQRK
ncbi:TPA: hypothetical protein ACGIK9_003389 [Acinetobacter baumannii]|uniref:hypothetical protein n=1 Tax=Acinetobacter baumannii TaxID=470 RepID=UPI00338F7FDA